MELSKSERAETAAESIRTYGWQKGELGAKDRGYCLMGAFVPQYQESGWSLDEQRAVADIISPGLPAVRLPMNPDSFQSKNGFMQKFDEVTYVNDYQLQSKEEAVDVLMDAAKHWRDKGE